MGGDNLFSDYWHRVAEARPRLRSHVNIHQHSYRGELWYVLHDPISNTQHRLNGISYQIVGLMNGKNSLDDIWTIAIDRLGESLPSQQEIITLLGNLYQAGLVQSDKVPDLLEISSRKRRLKADKTWAKLKSPMSIKIPLIDIAPFLDKTRWLPPILFNKPVFVLWLLAMFWLAYQAVTHWAALSDNIVDRLLSAESLLQIWFVYPFVKLLHELAHGWAVRRWGGEVHELGVMFLVFIPVPYVDASASTAFRNKHERAIVAAAGIIMELSICAFAMLIYLGAEPGTVKSVAYNVLLIAGVSTLLFNGNPLLKFDAYYCLSDILEIPNLATRGSKQIGSIVREWLSSEKASIPVAQDRSEAIWLSIYAVASYFYRLFVTLSIALLVSVKFFYFGIALALWAIYSSILAPMNKALKGGVALFRNSRFRMRITVRSLSVVFLVVGGVFFLPLPNNNIVEGVIVGQPDSRVVVGVGGFVQRINVSGGVSVKEASKLLELDNQKLTSELKILRALGDEIKHEYEKVVAKSAVGAQLLLSEMERLEQETSLLLQDIDALVVRSEQDGVYFSELIGVLPGLYLPQGALVGHVQAGGVQIARVAVRQEDAGDVRDNTLGIMIKLASNIPVELEGRLVGEVPSALFELPDPALSVVGGGDFALDPSSSDKAKTVLPVFQFDVALDYAEPLRIGERAYVKFEHQPNTLWDKGYKATRQIFLSALSI